MKKLIMLRGRRMLRVYGLNDWTFCIDTRPRRRRLGQCREKRREIGVCLWWLEHLEKFHDEDTIVDLMDNVILHEIAHALTPGAGHRRKWQQKYADVLCSWFGQHSDADNSFSFGVGAVSFVRTCRFCRTSLLKGKIKLTDRTAHPLRFGWPRSMKELAT